MKIRAEINEIETPPKKTPNIQRINKTKRWFFEKVNKIYKLLANLTKLRREKTHINEIRNKKRDNNKYQGNPENLQGQL
jgi:hypothetical protein